MVSWRALNQHEQQDLISLKAYINNVSLSNSLESVKWALEPSGNFSVKSIYGKLLHGPKVNYAKALWAARIPPKVKMFLWQAFLDRLPSAINLQKRHGLGNGSCTLCGA